MTQMQYIPCPSSCPWRGTLALQVRGPLPLLLQTLQALPSTGLGAQALGGRGHSARDTPLQPGSAAAGARPGV